MIYRLGIDVGGVLSDRVNETEDTAFMSDNFLKSPAVPGMFDAVRNLIQQHFHDNVWIVSKCGPVVEEKTRQWLEHLDFYAHTGVSIDNLRFVRKREDKAPVCRELGITHFVDDRTDVLDTLVTVPHTFWFVGGNPATDESVQVSGSHIRVETAADLVPAIERTLA